MWKALSKLAGSKLVSYVGVVLAAIGVICQTMRGDVVDAFGDTGIKICGLITLIGALSAALGRGVGDRRDGDTSTAVTGAPLATEHFLSAAPPVNLLRRRK